ncbi:MAG: rod shape-determining protein MreD, partial [Proteobacteria bacterium]|nr:rod shape-determining protein MreD [Pseudomonadota bacterium]
WVIYRPDLFSAPWSFVLGLLHDALVGQFLGVGALSYLLADFILRAQRTFFLNLSFFQAWMVYALVFTGAMMLQWGLSSLIDTTFLDLLPVVSRLVLGILLFPLVTGILHQLQPALRHV